ncbi:MAG: NTP transferase domain-containing protein [Proteobacteria bacterium]|nr:NTP transferase domain-containing protein [Pseudomonadota bacterium]
MKAMVLAAGFGTRLRPHTETLPKPLLPMGGIPLMDRVLDALEAAGFEEAVVNAHHLAGRMVEHLSGRCGRMRIRCLTEAEILGTGGGIENAREFLRDAPFLVVNADVVTDFDLDRAASFHAGHSDPVTLVLCRHPKFDTVRVEEGLVKGFTPVPGHAGPLCTFTGIHVLDPLVFQYLSPGFSSIIDAYNRMLGDGHRIRALLPPDLFWQDAGSPEGMVSAALALGAVRVLSQESRPGEVEIHPLAGDGSDRRWWRVRLGDRTAVAAGHGMGPGPGADEARAMKEIGRHLKICGIPVPDILGEDRFCGLVFAQDLGDIHLSRLASQGMDGRVAGLYRVVVRDLARMNVEGATGFNVSWTWQTPFYDAELALERESRYFLESFVRDHLGLDVEFEDYRAELESLSCRAVDGATTGFLHRDFQSRNILVFQDKPFLIDFAGGRLGPLGYDLASLLLDPYARLPRAFQNELFALYVEAVSRRMDLDREDFALRYELLALHRNMQVLGAFALLGGRRGKPGFLEHIPHAMESLSQRVARVPGTPGLAALVKRLKTEMETRT